MQVQQAALSRSLDQLNSATSSARSKLIAGLVDAHAVESERTSDWNDCELLENAELVHKTLDRLSLPHREVLTLRFLEGLDLSQISEVVGCSIGTVKSRLHHAKSAMRKLLETS